VRSDLQKIQGVSGIRTDIANRTCQFRLSNTEIDLAASLNEFAKTNSHLAGWSRVEPAH
jgi:hypothetical protein